MAAKKKTNSLLAQIPTEELRTVARGQGRMEQARVGVFIRLPTQLKRLAQAKALLEGCTLAEVIETSLHSYVTSD